MGKGMSFVAGVAVGAAAGAVLGVMFAPRSGSETRAMAADMANDAWDSARDMYAVSYTHLPPILRRALACSSRCSLRARRSTPRPCLRRPRSRR